MMVRDIPYIAGMFAVGNVIKIPKKVSEERTEYVEAEIIGKYPFFALVKEVKPNARYITKWCVLWKDFVRLGIQK